MNTGFEDISLGEMIIYLNDCYSLGEIIYMTDRYTNHLSTVLDSTLNRLLVVHLIF